MKESYVLKRIEQYRKTKPSYDNLVFDMFLERVFAAENLLNLVEKNSKERETILEARKYFLVTSVSSMESYYKCVVEYLLDSRKIPETNKRKFLESLRNVNFSIADLASLMKIQKGNISLGEIVAALRSFQNLENINQACSTLLGVKDFIAEVQSYEIEELDILLKNNFPNLKEVIEEAIQLRHSIIHGAFSKRVIGKRKSRMMFFNINALVMVSNYYITYITDALDNEKSSLRR